MRRTALVTGASRGIGRGIALGLAAEGYHLVVNYAGNRNAAEETATLCVNAGAENGHEVAAVICQADVGRTDDREKLTRFTRETFDHLDLLVNNAGVSTKVRGDLLDLREDSFDHLIGINLKGPFFLTQAIAKWMIEDGPSFESRECRPKIITIGSISAYAASTNRGDYCITKAGVGMATSLFADRLADEGICVYEVRPGVIDTDMTKGAKEKYDRLIADGLTPIRRWGTPEDVAKAVVGLASGILPFSTGEVINVDGGFHIRRL